MRVDYHEMTDEFERVLSKYGFGPDDRKLLARLFADASRDGVSSHGLDRFPAFIDFIRKGHIHVDSRAVKVLSLGSFERWDGQKGPGPLNATIAMKRAVEIAKENTVGVVALSNTNHWMRAGNYGLMAAENDCIGIMWTNTIQNMPAWGGKDRKIGNNPVVLAVPHSPCPVILDCAMSMFSYGKLNTLRRQGKETPVDAGYDRNGNVTRDPGEVADTMQVFPMGYWKGSGLSILLDLIASTLSGGKSTSSVGLGPETEICQFFMAIDISRLPDRAGIDEKIEKTLSDIRSSVPRDENHPVHVPGDGMARIRSESMEKGVIVDEEIWNTVKAM